MTSLENVLVGMHSRLKGGIVGSILRTPRIRREERAAHDLEQKFRPVAPLPLEFGRRVDRDVDRAAEARLQRPEERRGGRGFLPH